MSGFHKAKGGIMKQIKVIFMFLILGLVIGGLTTISSDDNEPLYGETGILTFETGFGPAEIEWIEIEDDGMGFSTVRVFFGEGQALMVAGDDSLQLRLYMDAADDIDYNLFFSAGYALLVTPDFDIIDPAVVYIVEPYQDAISFILPFSGPDLTVLASLGWDMAPQYFHTTLITGLNYLGFEISRFILGPYGIFGTNEIFFMSIGQQVQETDEKWWPIEPDEEAPDDGSNPPGGAPGPLYKGWPKKEGNVTFWEYSGDGGFVKRAHVDENGNGKIDPGEPDGYVGGCPYDPGDNSQAKSSGGSTWTSEWDGHGERIVHEFKKQKQPDGSEKWVVVSTHQTQQPDGSWQDTPVSDPHQNPIVGGPYQNPDNIPTRESFGL
jgi:hypothetical protein